MTYVGRASSLAPLAPIDAPPALRRLELDFEVAARSHAALARLQSLQTLLLATPSARPVLAPWPAAGACLGDLQAAMQRAALEPQARLAVADVRQLLIVLAELACSGRLETVEWAESSGEPAEGFKLAQPAALSALRRRVVARYPALMLAVDPLPALPR